MNDVERTIPIRSEPIRPADADPLPRRRSQAHLEPQLREPGGAGTATPFTAFDAAAPDAPAPVTADDPETTRARRADAGTRAATFRSATRSGRAHEPRPRA